MVKYKGIVWFVFLFIIFSWLMHACFAANRADADQALTDAEDNLGSAYVTVAQAERAGANVSKLLDKLRFAEILLVDAYYAYRIGDYDKAYLHAMNCSSRVDGVVSEASSLRLDAEKAYNERLLFTAGVSSVGLSVLFVLSLFCWRFLKSRYFRRILEMKPEVGKAE